MDAVGMCPDDLEGCLRMSEARRARALVEGDLGILEQLCDDRLVYTHSVGRRDSKESLLESLRSGSVRYHRIEHDLEEVLLADGGAWISGRMCAEITSRGQRRQLDTLTTSVWIRSGREWKLLAFHTTTRAD